jgi:hypothetical protein
MKTFLKVLLVVILAMVAIKLLPATFALGCILAVGLAILAAVGVSVLAIGLYVALAIVALLSPIWLPILAIVGIIALIKRWRRPAVVTV